MVLLRARLPVTTPHYVCKQYLRMRVNVSGKRSYRFVIDIVLASCTLTKSYICILLQLYKIQLCDETMQRYKTNSSLALKQ